MKDKTPLFITVILLIGLLFTSTSISKASPVSDLTSKDMQTRISQLEKKILKLEIELLVLKKDAAKARKVINCIKIKNSSLFTFPITMAKCLQANI